MNITHLKYFYDAALLKSVSAAARVNHVSQSAVSQGITKLEKLLHIQLSTHQKQSFKLTEEGSLFFEEVKKVFNALDGLKENVGKIKNEIVGDVKFACTHSLGHYYLPPYFYKFRNLYPLINIEFKRGSLEFIHEALKSRRVHFGLVLNAFQFNPYEVEILYTGEFNFFRSKTNQKNKGLFISNEPNVEIYQLKQFYRKAYQKDLTIQETLPDWSMVANYVQMGWGIGYLPDFMVNQSSSIKKISLKIPPIQYQIVAIQPKGEYLPQAAKLFLEMLKTKLNNTV